MEGIAVAVGPASARRGELDRVLAGARPGDVLVTPRLTTLAPSVRGVLDIVARTLGGQVGVLALDGTIDTSDPATGTAVRRALEALHEVQRDGIRAGTRVGLQAARARGRTGGRHPTMTPDDIAQARQMYAETGPDGKRRWTVAQIATELGVSRATIYRNLPSKDPRA
nr:recombinase family protein [Actinomadura sp. RB99]